MTIDVELRQILEEIREGSREGKEWRARAQQQLEDSGKTLVALSGQIDELDLVVKLQFENGRARFADHASRLLGLEEAARRGGGAVDVNISQGNQTVGPEAAATATKPGLLKPAATLGGGGIFGWLAGGGWEQVTALIKKLTG
jgi:hypothetical protein